MIKTVGVVGAGMMGAEIALCFALKGYKTFITDVNEEMAKKGKEKQKNVLSKSVSKGRITEEEKVSALDNVFPTGDISDLKDCDLIIEAVLEKYDIKEEVYSNLNKICKDDAIIASNTSSISISKLSGGISEERKGKFLGIHFNSPASIMKLVEVIPALLTDEKTVEEAILVLEDIDKVPVKVKDVVGFGLNRIFHCMYLEACRLVEEGVCSIEDVDKICKYGLGHPMGIFALLDNLGLDLAYTVDEIMFEGYGERFRPSPQLKRRVDSGMLGRKSGSGFYDYK